MEFKRINLPLDERTICSLKAGDSVLLNGEMITGRDAAHKRLLADLKNNQLPVDIKGETIFYVGPCPKKADMALGSCGPTTSARMDAFAPTLLENGLKGMIGKGFRKPEVIQSIKQNCCVYFAAIGGAGAIYADCVVKAEPIAYHDLMSEAIYRLTVKDFPVIVAVDCEGNTIYK